LYELEFGINALGGQGINMNTEQGGGQYHDRGDCHHHQS